MSSSALRKLSIDRRPNVVQLLFEFAKHGAKQIISLVVAAPVWLTFYF